MRIGTGWDLHRLETGRQLVLGGVVIPFEKGCLAHSDGDVLIHAMIDALLGSAALGDIGTLFPDSDETYKNADSTELLRNVLEFVKKAGYGIVNIDSTIILERPKIGPYITRIRKNIASCLMLDESAVSVKAKTAEKTGAVGLGEAIEAMAVVLIEEA